MIYGESRKCGLFLCEICGSETEYRLLVGTNRKSCGCIHRHLNGASSHPLYDSWSQMLRRCNVTHNKAYKNYGGRGINDCDEWNDFFIFKKWALLNGYEKKLFIDRIDNDGNYEPSNCRFTTRTINNQNQRTNKLTPDLVRELRRMHALNKYMNIELAKYFGISINYVSRVVHGGAWANIK